MKDQTPKSIIMRDVRTIKVQYGSRLSSLLCLPDSPRFLAHPLLKSTGFDRQVSLPTSMELCAIN